MAGGIALAPLITQMKVDIRTFRSDMDRVRVEAVERARTVSREMESVAKVGEKMTDIGGAMTKKITLPIVGAGTAITKFNMDFSDSVAKVSTIADTTKVPIDTLKKGILDLSDKTGVAATDLNEALYQSISASVDTAEAVRFVEVATKAAKGGFTDAAIAVDGLSTVLNSYGIEASKTDVIANQMLITQNKGKTSFGELASSVGKITPIAAQLGITTEELFSSLASTTAQGLATSESVTALKAAMSNVIKPSKEASDAAELLGIEFTAGALATKGWMPFLTEIKEKLAQASPEFDRLNERATINATKMAELESQGKKNTEEYRNLSKYHKNIMKDLELLAKASDSPIAAFANIFGSVEGLNSILMLTSENGMRIYNETMKEMETNTTALDDAFNKMDQTPGQEMKKALNDIKNLGIEMGDILMPVVRDVIAGIRGVAEGFKNLSPGTKEAIVKTALFAATMGPLVSITGKTITVFTKLKPVVSGLGTVFGSGAPLVGKFLSKLGLAKTVGATATTALSGVGTAAGTAAGAGGLGALAGSLGTAALAAAPFVAGAAAVGAAAYGVHKVMSKEVVPTVDLYADKVEYVSKSVTDSSGRMRMQAEKNTIVISESTKKAVSSYMELDEKLSKTMYDIQVSSKTFSEDTKKNVIGQYTEMINGTSSLTNDMKNKNLENFKHMVSGMGTLSEQNKTKMIEDYRAMVNTRTDLNEEMKQKQIQQFTDMLTHATGITAQQKDAVVQQVTEMGNMVITAEQENHNTRKQELTNFFAETGALTQQEQGEIMGKVTAHHEERIKTVNEKMQKITSIYENAAKNNREITEQEKQEINKLQSEIRDHAINTLSATEEEAAVIRQRMKDYQGRLTAEMASEMISKANKARDKEIKAAEEKYDGVIREAARMKQAGDLNDEQYNRIIKKANETKKAQIDKAMEACEGVKTEIMKATPGIEKEVNIQTGTIKNAYQKLSDWISDTWEWIKTKAKDVADTVGSTMSVGGVPRPDGGHYNGLNYVPFDGYVARLHKGERVLTAEENKDYIQGKEGGKGNMTVNFYGNISSPSENARRLKNTMVDAGFIF